MDRPLVVGIGRAGISLLGVTPSLPDNDRVAQLSEVSVQVGGSACLAIGTSVAMGCAGRLCTKLADDFFAPFIRNALAAAGIDFRAVRAEGRLSPFTFTLQSESSQRRIAVATEGDVATLHDTELDLDVLLRGASALIVDGAFPQAQLAAAEAARAQQIPVVFDGERVSEGLGDLVAIADVVISSERLASELAPTGELNHALAEIQRLGPRVVILTLGEAGSIGLCEDELVEQAAFEVDVVDAAGAGYVYHGAFVTAVLNKMPFAQCMEFASAAAALSCRSRGTWAGIPTKQQVIELVRHQHVH